MTTEVKPEVEGARFTVITPATRESVGEYPVAEFGECHAAARLLHDGPANHGLNLSHVLADGGLRHVQHGGRAVKSATIRDRHDASQRGDVQHSSHPTKIL